MTVTREGIPPGGALRWDEAASTWAREASKVAEGMLRSHAPFRTGALRASIKSRTEPSPGMVLVVLYATAPYTKLVLEGTRAHPIAARNARALRWLGPGGMGVHFAKHVNHPGTKADPFPDRAMPLVSPAIARLFAVAVQEAMG